MKIHLLWKAMLACLLLTSLTTIDEPKEILLWPNGAPGSEGKMGNDK
jgi:hypothetical protein